MQYRNKIIALFMTVCLLVTSLCVPVSAASSSGAMLYNGVELPVLPDKYNATTFKYFIISKDTNGLYQLYICSTPGYFYPSTMVNSQSWSNIIYQMGTNYNYTCNDGDDVWTYDSTSNGSIVHSGSKFGWPARTAFFANYDVLNNSDNSLYLAASDPVDPNAPVGTMTHYTTNFGSDYSHTTFEVGGLSENDTYFIRGYCYQDSSLIATLDSPSWTGSGTYCTVEFSGLLPSTTYDFEYVLYVNDEETAVTYTNSVTTLEDSSGGGDSGGDGGTGDGGGGSGGCTECPSILSSILSAITNQSTFFAEWKQAWTSRMDSLEDAVVSAISALAPVSDPTETALKESVKDTTQEVTDSLFADDAPTKVTASDVKDVAEIGSAASSMFDSGVSIGSFFDALNNVSFLSVFTQKMVNSMNTVNAVSAISGDGFDSTEYYHKNLEEIRDFVNGG